jgi:hypothetical protein
MIRLIGGNDRREAIERGLGLMLAHRLRGRLDLWCHPVFQRWKLGRGWRGSRLHRQGQRRDQIQHDPSSRPRAHSAACHTHSPDIVMDR